MESTRPDILADTFKTLARGSPLTERGPAEKHTVSLKSRLSAVEASEVYSEGGAQKSNQAPTVLEMLALLFAHRLRVQQYCVNGAASSELERGKGV